MNKINTYAIDYNLKLKIFDEIESLTGYDFFELLSDDVESVLEARAS